MKVMAPAHPLVAKIGYVQFETVFIESPNDVWESDRFTASTKSYSYDKGSGLS